MTKKAAANKVIDLAQRARELRVKKALAGKGPSSQAIKAMLLGLHYLHGDALERNPSKAARFFATAAQGGSTQARHELALLHLKGEAVDYDPDYAVSLLLSASEDGYTASSIALAELYIFGRHCPPDSGKALLLLHQVVSEDEPAAMYYLAYLHDKDPQLQNSFEAAYWYRRAAEHGHFKSQIRLASLYATGDGVPQSLATAEAFLDVALQSTSKQDPRFLLWQSESLAGQPETEFVARALIKAAADLQYAPAKRLLLQRGWRR